MKRISVFSAILASVALGASVHAEIPRAEPPLPREPKVQPPVVKVRVVQPRRPEPPLPREPMVQPPIVKPRQPEPPLPREPKVQPPSVKPQQPQPPLPPFSRVQLQAQQEVILQAQVQGQQRVQADAARAAEVVQRAVEMSQRQAEAAKQRTTGALNARIGADVAASKRADASVSTPAGATNAATKAQLGLETRMVVPPGLNEGDVKIFDDIFGEFNPFRRRDVAGNEPTTEAPTPGTESPGFATTQDVNSDAGLRGQGHSRRAEAGDVLDFTTRLRMAARERRAEISEMRDRALATGDAQALLRAHRAEQALNAFVAAQARVQANTEGKPAPGILPMHPPVANPIPEPPMPPTSGVTTVGGSSDTDTTTTTTADAVQPAN